MIDLAPLEDLQFAYQLDGFDEPFESWQERLAGPEWVRYGIEKDGDLCGVLGWEKVDDVSCGIHITFKRRALTPLEAVRLVVNSGILLFRAGIQRLYTNGETRPARWLAIRSGMTRIENERFQLTAEEYFSDPQKWEKIKDGRA